MVDKLGSDEQPYVKNEGTTSDVILKFGIPAGATGPTGATGATGDTGDTGPVGTILGSYTTLQNLIDDHPGGGNQGDAYLVGGELYVWDVATDSWKPVGNLQGPTGPAGTIGSDQELFTVSAPTGSADVTYEGNLNFTSDTLDISVGPGSTVKIEEPKRVGAIIPFSSGIQLSTNTRTGTGERLNVAIVGFGNGVTIASTADPIVLPVSGAISDTVQIDFSIPADGIITSISAFYTAMSGGLVGVDTYITAQLFQTRDPDSREFYAIPGTDVEFDLISGSVLPSVLRQKIVTGLSIPVEAHTRLLIGFFNKTPGYTATSTVMSGYMSGSLEIR